MPGTAALVRRLLVVAAVLVVVVLTATARIGGGVPVIKEWVVVVASNDLGVRVSERLLEDGGTRGVGPVVRRVAHDGGVPKGGVVKDVDANFLWADYTMTVEGDLSTLELFRSGGRHQSSDGFFYDLDETWPIGTSFTRRLVLADPTLDANRIRVLIVGVEFTAVTCSVDDGDAECTVVDHPDHIELVVRDFPAGATLRLDATVSRLVEIDDGFDPPDLRADSLSSSDEVEYLRLGLAALVIASVAAAIGVLSASSTRRRASAGSAGPIDLEDEPGRDDPSVEPRLPQGVEPWQGMVLATGISNDQRIVDVWFSQLMVDGYFQPGSQRWTWARGPEWDTLEPRLQRAIDASLVDGELVPGLTHPRALRLWNRRRRELLGELRRRRWWSVFGRESWLRTTAATSAVLAILTATVVVTMRSFVANDWWVALAVVAGVPFVAAVITYTGVQAHEAPEVAPIREELKELRAALHAGDPRAAEAAAAHGTLAACSSWAVALGCALQWDEAIRATTLPAAAKRAAAAPLWPRLLDLPWAAMRLGPGMAYGFDPDGDMPPPYSDEPVGSAT